MGGAKECVPDLVIYDVLRADSGVDLTLEVFVFKLDKRRGSREVCASKLRHPTRSFFHHLDDDRPIRDLPERYSCTLPALRVGEDRRE